MSRILRDQTFGTSLVLRKPHLLNAQWVCGFVDGEGCFHIQINSQPSIKLKTQILAEFVVSQHVRDISLMYALKDYFGCGVVRRANECIVQYRVTSLQHHCEIK